MKLVTPGKSGEEQEMPEHRLGSPRCRRRGGGAEGLATRRTRARLGGSGGVGVARSGPRASMADADRTCRVRCRYCTSALNAYPTLPPPTTHLTAPHLSPTQPPPLTSP